jgi:hypothetical protein
MAMPSVEPAKVYRKREEVSFSSNNDDLNHNLLNRFNFTKDRHAPSLLSGPSFFMGCLVTLSNQSCRSAVNRGTGIAQRQAGRLAQDPRRAVGGERIGKPTSMIVLRSSRQLELKVVPEIRGSYPGYS